MELKQSMIYNVFFRMEPGSYDVVKKNVDVWKNQFYASTKVTFASADLKYLEGSIIELWQEGIPEIAANVVFEDVWKEDDDKFLKSSCVNWQIIF